MTANIVYDQFSSLFDAVGIITSSHYMDEAKNMGKTVPDAPYPTMVVLGLSYPNRIIKHTDKELIPSFYTFGMDYHHVLEERIHQVMKHLPYAYELGVDNHEHDERLAATLAGIGYFAKNQLIIHPSFGSYLFLGIVFIDVTLEETYTHLLDDDCGTCRKCINACPTNALSEEGYHMDRCISFFNQEKIVFSENNIKDNYSLFGCDICQMVCPKNIHRNQLIHPEFELNGKEKVSITDLLTLSEKTFKYHYNGMAYLWKGKTILMRNAVGLIEKRQMVNYIPMIEETLKKNYADWYIKTAVQTLKRMKEKQNHEQST